MRRRTAARAWRLQRGFAAGYQRENAVGQEAREPGADLYSACCPPRPPPISRVEAAGRGPGHAASLCRGRAGLRRCFAPARRRLVGAPIPAPRGPDASPPRCRRRAAFLRGLLPPRPPAGYPSTPQTVPSCAAPAVKQPRKPGAGPPAYALIRVATFHQARCPPASGNPACRPLRHSHIPRVPRPHLLLAAPRRTPVRPPRGPPGRRTRLPKRKRRPSPLLARLPHPSAAPCWGGGLRQCGHFAPASRFARPPPATHDYLLTVLLHLARPPTRTSCPGPPKYYKAEKHENRGSEGTPVRARVIIKPRLYSPGSDVPAGRPSINDGHKSGRPGRPHPGIGRVSEERDSKIRSVYDPFKEHPSLK
ncbi:basic proline-rich protein-like [Penaeus indicus]|uniref:basic proline-rich protein-like n=1 Tax=Penaeus indicus TaxID=29960 RepID=UPI00300C15BF